MWVARDKDEDLGLWEIKPHRSTGSWYNYVDGSEDSQWMLLDSLLFPELKWEDEPIEVELISKQELNILKKRAKQAPTIPYMGY